MRQPCRCIPGLSVLLLSLALLLPGSVTAELKGYEDDLGSGPALLIDIDAGDGTAAIPPELSFCPTDQFPANTVYATGFTSGFAFVGDTLYGLEFDTSGTPDVYLYTMDTSFCARGMRVREQPIGVNLDSLAAGPDDFTLYTVDFDTSAHLAELLKIDLRDNSVTPAGRHMARDVWIVGLAYDRATGELFGLSSGFADRNIQELYRIDLATGVETLIGVTGTSPQQLQGLALDPSTNPARLLATGTRLYEIDRTTGQASPIGGSFATVYALAEREIAGMFPTATPTLSATPMASSTPSATSPPQATPTRGPCFGDCNGDGRVAVNELIRGVNIALEILDIGQCREFDSNDDGVVNVAELIRAVNAALFGCQTP